MFTAPISRRGAFGHLLTALAIPMLASGALAAPVAPDRRRSTAALIRTIFPHDRLDDAFYQKAAATYIGELAAPQLAALDQMLATLDGSRMAAFADLPAVIRTSLVAKVDQQPAFLQIRARAAEIVYRDRAVWKMVGYEGSSIEHGGYRDQGFDDIDWLPAKGAKA